MKKIIFPFVLSCLIVFWLSATAIDRSIVIAASILLGLMDMVVFVAVVVAEVRNVKTTTLIATLIFSLLFMSSIAATGWSLRVLFVLSREPIETTARLVENGHQIKTPVRLGVFKITKVQLLNGTVCLWTRTLPDKDGFVKTSSTGIQRFNVWSTVELSNEWQFLWED